MALTDKFLNNLNEFASYTITITNYKTTTTTITKRGYFHHKMGFFKGLIIFSTGVYSGIYASQHYTIPPVDDPKQLFEKLQEYLKQFEKSSTTDAESKKKW